ncbi:S4 domain-containing protein [Microbulbifer sp. MLAF003]|uniref:RNA-binding S4 domain-containing protein n=1 Tax=Microbulbifer sp. MLAF003 TaxID=3032582 RepID=UPI0024AD985F|nr:S4 domain-containing protein [Microbulbifer sp. MLAF003]WHI51479.1 S4 domain-containing protein [Microbulbifer sp. MLAF003]
MEKVRIDKWLWAARFFKTRSIAKQAIDGGKVHADGQRVKASKEVSVGAVLSIRQGWDQLEVEVIALSGQRRSADIARTLYRETDESIDRRERERSERQAANAGIQRERPNKKQRRQIHRFLREQK